MTRGIPLLASVLICCSIAAPALTRRGQIAEAPDLPCVLAALRNHHGTSLARMREDASGDGYLLTWRGLVPFERPVLEYVIAGKEYGLAFQIARGRPVEVFHAGVLSSREAPVSELVQTRLQLVRVEEDLEMHCGVEGLSDLEQSCNAKYCDGLAVGL